MNTRRVMTWLIFWSSVAFALAALAWVSVEVVALEKREALAQDRAVHQENVRRALWRMDSQMAPILAIEASRPYTDYQPIVEADAAWLKDAKDEIQEKIRTVSQDGRGYANSYFEFESLEDAGQGLGQAEEISSLINSVQLLKEQPGQAKKVYLQSPNQSQENSEVGVSFEFATDNQLEAVTALAPVADEADSDFDARQRIADIASNKAVSRSGRAKGYQYDDRLDAQEEPESTLFEGLTQSSGFMDTFDEDDLARSSRVELQTIGSLEPRWITDDSGMMQLVLVRSAIIDEQQVVQGVWLDWDALRADLLDSVNDVMPGSSLIAVTGPRSSMAGRYQLATIPVAFIPSSSMSVVAWKWSPATVGLVVTWVAILSTIIAVGVVLRAAIVLSDRRGMFVSAVTHELRTPLTTFRLYSQMLADGMVSDEDVRKDYLQILKRESERLTGIVENVLEYARLTRQRSSKDKAAGVQTLTPGALIARFRPALARRAGQSNLDLVVSMDIEAHADRTLTADPHAVERIMMNLIENACKYAAPSEEDAGSIEDADTRIHLDMSINNEMLELLVADHGSGIALGEAARIFGEFQRGRRGLSNARSGLGLGLALSRGLAREMGGDLILTKRRGHGAEFLLTIPLD